MSQSTMTRSPRPFASLFGWASRSAISSAFLLLAAGVALGLLGTYGSARGFVLVGEYGPKGIIAACLLVPFTLCVLCASVHLARRARPLRPSWFLLALVVGGAAAHLLLNILVKPVWGTDYMRYWEYAQRLVEQGQYGGMDRPYYARSLFVPYPVVRLFGPEATYALKLANIALLGGIQLGGYDLMRRILGHQAAQAGSLLLLAAPIPAFASMIPSHDLWGLFFLTASLWAVVLAYDLWKRQGSGVLAPASVAALAGLLAYVAEVQRNLGFVFCASLLAGAALTWAGSAGNGPAAKREWLRRFFVLALVCIAAYSIASAADERVGLRADDRPTLMNMKFAANASGMGSGRSDWFARFETRFSEGYSTPERSADLFKSLALSSWALAPVDSTARIAKQSERLFSLTYLRDWDWLLREPSGISPGAKEAMLFYADLYGLLYGMLLLFAVVRLTLAARTPDPVLTCAGMFVVALATPLLLAFENKPYNIFPIWMVGALLIAAQLRPADPTHEAAPARPWWRSPALGGLLLVAGTAVLVPLAVRSSFTESDGRLFSRWSLHTTQADVPGDWRERLRERSPEAFSRSALSRTEIQSINLRLADEDGDRIRKYASQNYLKLEFPSPPSKGDLLQARTRICTTDPARNMIEFFLYAPAHEAGRGGGPEAKFDVSVDGEVSNALDIPLEGADFQRVLVRDALATGACHDVALRIRATGPNPPGAGVGPGVEIWLPRLVRPAAPPSSRKERLWLHSSKNG